MGDQFVKPVLKQFSGELTTTGDTYEVVPNDVDSSEYWYVKGFANLTIHLTCSTKKLFYKIEAAPSTTGNIPGDWDDLGIVDEYIAADETVIEEISQPIDFLRVSIRPVVSGENGKINVVIRGSSV